MGLLTIQSMDHVEQTCIRSGMKQAVDSVLPSAGAVVPIARTTDLPVRMSSRADMDFSWPPFPNLVDNVIR